LRTLQGFAAGGAGASGKPYFGVLHLSNTHAPYRVDPDLQPFEPHAKDPLGDVGLLHNHYRNSVLLQERTIAAFLREVRALEGWDDTAVFVLSDHGEQFRERGGLYHLHSLFDEEVRVPGFVLAGSRALHDDQKAALRTFAGKRTYFTDVHATIVDLFGLGAARATLPFANPNARSLIDKRGWNGEPTVLLSTATAVWDEDDIRYAVMRGDKLLSGVPGKSWTCFDSAQDPGQQFGLPPEKCGQRMIDLADGLPR
jgi:arylsulfatase A-like enzyme